MVVVVSVKKILVTTLLYVKFQKYPLKIHNGLKKNFKSLCTNWALKSKVGIQIKSSLLLPKLQFIHSVIMPYFCNSQNEFLLILGGRFLVEEHNGHTLHMGAQWVHGVCEDNAMFKLAEKYGLLDNSMERDGFGDMNHESFDLEHVYLKDGVLVSENLAVIAGEIHTKICEKLQSLFEDDQVEPTSQSNNSNFCPLPISM